MLSASQALEPAVNHDAQSRTQGFTLLHTANKHISTLVLLKLNVKQKLRLI